MTQPQFVSAAEVSRNFGLWQDRTGQAPLIVTHHGRPRIAMIAIETFEAFSRGHVGAGGPLNEDEEMRLAVLAEHLDGAFVSFDQDLRLTRLSSDALLHFDQPASALIGRTLPELHPKTLQGPVLAALRRVADGGEETYIDLPSLLRPELLLRLRIFAYPGGVAVIFRNVAHEVKTEHDKLERQALFAAREALGGVFVARLSLRGTFDREEVGLAGIVGFPAGRIRGMRLLDLLAPAARGAATEAIEATLGHGETSRFPSQLVVTDGSTRQVCVGLAPIREGFGITGAMMMMTMAND